MPLPLILALSVDGFLTGLLVAFGIGLVIFVHELGHFLAARRMGVHVEVFSLGFGPRLVGIVRRGTDYRISIVPVGGYVKVAGDQPGEGAGAPDELLSRGVGQRALFFSGGVLMNVLFGLVVFPLVFAAGVPMREARIGTVLPGGPAWKAGLREGDLIRSAGGHEVLAWEDVVLEVALGDPHGIEIVAERDGEVRAFHVRPEYDEFRGIRTLQAHPSFADGVEILPGGPAQRAGLTEADRLLEIDGEPVTAQALQSLVPQETAESDNGTHVVLVEDPTGSRRAVKLEPEARPEDGRYVLGIRSVLNVVAGVRGAFADASSPPLAEGDVLLAVAGRAIHSPDDVVAALDQHGDDSAVPVTFRRDGERLEVALEPELARVLPDDIALTRERESELGVHVDVAPGSPAARAGIRSGERLRTVQGEPTERWADILELMDGADGSPVEVSVAAADGGTRNATIHPERALLVSYGLLAKPSYVTHRFSAGTAFQAGLRASWNLSRQFYLTLRKMLVREVSTDNLGGIVAISSVSYQFAQLGLAKLFYFLAMLSIQLAFINVLPIPVLDGGHLLFLAIEKVKGSPVSEKVVGYSQVVGLVIVLSLLIYVTYNDIQRIFL